MPAPARKIRDVHDADACLSALAESGLSLARWARAHGVDGRSLNMWRINRSRSIQTAPASPAIRLVELLPISASAPTSSFRVHVDDLVVDVPDGFDPDALGRLVGVLRRC